MSINTFPPAYQAIVDELVKIRQLLEQQRQQPPAVQDGKKRERSPRS